MKEIWQLKKYEKQAGVSSYSDTVFPWACVICGNQYIYLILNAHDEKELST